MSTKSIFAPTKYAVVAEARNVIGDVIIISSRFHFSAIATKCKAVVPL